MTLEIDPKYVAQVLERLTSKPTAQDIDYLIEAHTTIGYYASVVQADAELAEAERKNAEANAFQQKRLEDPKSTAAALEAFAITSCFAYRRAEIKARMNAKKLSNLWDSVRQAIDAVKFISKNTEVKTGW